MALASSGSKLAISMDLANMRGALNKTSHQLYRIGRCTPVQKRQPPCKLQQALHHRGPRLCQIRAVVPAAAQPQYPSMAQAIRQLRQFAGGLAVRSRRITQVRDWIAFETVRPALKNDELGRELFQVRDHRRPGCIKPRVIRAGWHRNIEHRAARSALPSLSSLTGPRIEILSVLVQVSEYHPCIVLKRIEHTVTVVRINVDISDAREAKGAPQNLNRHPTVVEHAEPGSTVPRSMMKAGNRNKRPPTLP